MSSQAIPEAAVEAAFESLFAADAGMKEFKRATWLPTINKILEAAAPHLMAEAWEVGMVSMYASTGGEWPLIPEQNPYRSAK